MIAPGGSDLAIVVPAGDSDGQFIWVVRVGVGQTGSVTVSPDGGLMFIDLAGNTIASLSLPNAGGSIEFMFRVADTTWYIVGGNTVLSGV
jgi:hypothetical protein